ncbi:unnamed protein product [Leptosia nina]|uniref:Uncharacterized protein n=1 Tax=Leptosia nina TaxID=320188 RepID=A0AAV1JZL3_9NEOP
MNVLAMHKYNKNFVKFWNSTKKINGVTKLPTNINNEEDPLLIANTFASHFRVSPLPIPSPAIKIDGSRVCVGDDDRLISPETIALIIKQMSRGKSPGFDGLSLEHILFAGKEIFSKLRHYDPRDPTDLNLSERLMQQYMQNHKSNMQTIYSIIHDSSFAEREAITLRHNSHREPETDYAPDQTVYINNPMTSRRKVAPRYLADKVVSNQPIHIYTSKKKLPVSKSRPKRLPKSKT